MVRSLLVQGGVSPGSRDPVETRDRGGVLFLAENVGVDLQCRVRGGVAEPLRDLIDGDASAARRTARSELGRAPRDPDRQDLVTRLEEANRRDRALRETRARAAALEAAGHGRPESAFLRADQIEENTALRQVLSAAVEMERAQAETIMQNYQAGIRRPRENHPMRTSLTEFDAPVPADVGRSGLEI